MVNFQIVRWQQHFAPNAANLQWQMEREGFRVFRWCDRPEAIFALHKHNEDQSHWVISGSLELMIENIGTYVLEAGDRDFLPAHSWHSARVLGEEPVIYLVGEKIK